MADGKPTVILLHGVGLDKTCWDAQLPALEPHANVITYDLLGHGDCRKPDQDVTLHDYAEQLREVMDQHGVDRAIPVGFSFGGLTLQLFSTLYPERLEKLVIMGAVYKRTDEQVARVRERLELAKTEGPGAIIEAALARWYAPEYQEANPDVIAATKSRLMRNIPHEFLTAYEIFVTSDHLVTDQLSSITVPALVIAGELDPGSTPAMAAQMASEIPDARLCVIPGARHMLPVESAGAVNRALVEFISE
ncbi:MAG: alpha/beta fold hydrolase [Pseudomonadota bacterium]